VNDHASAWLEIGTGSGYQTAVLAELGISVFSVERLKALSEVARERLRALGYRNVHFGYNDGNAGWASHGPYDASSSLRRRRACRRRCSISSTSTAVW